ncbi:MAG: cobalamin biosynthesis protein CbiG [Bacteroidia bacterium]|nr:cobalamin biosynthesis protein CbiG [Bacteroidia bacterium]
MEDPAVIVADERGHFVIPLLCGHLGGANALALTIAKRIGATPVVTTATDLYGAFAVDIFAQKNHLWIEDMNLAKAVSAALLAGKQVGFQSDVPCVGTLPEGLTENETELGICVTSEPCKAPFARTLRLFPKRYTAGLGCRRGKTMEEIETFLLKQLSDSDAMIRELRCVASIDLKKNEPGLVLLCQKYRLPFFTYSAKQLSTVPGVFSGSDFVKGITGVDSVCERAAVLVSGGKLVRPKTAADGMTFALAEYEEAIRFE